MTDKNNITASKFSAFLAVSVLLTACNTAPVADGGAEGQVLPSAGKIDTESYRLGVYLIKSLRESSSPVELKSFEQGLNDALNGRAKAGPLTEEGWRKLADLNFAALKTANRETGAAFLAQNKLKKDIVELPSGVQYQILQEGKGDTPRPRDTIGILYKITGLDGSVKVDTMIKGKSKMYEIKLEKMLSKGWQEALQKMPLNSKWRLFIPGELAFGENGLTEKGIMPNEALIIDTYLLEIK